jgi:hypothetical protein
VGGETRDKRRRLSVREHAPDLTFEHGRFVQPPLFGQPEQLIVGDAAPQEKRTGARPVQVADAVDADRRDTGRIALNPELELRTRAEAA